MKILGIETSCDETAVAILEEKGGHIQILSNIVASSASLQAKYGGIIPEQAAREQLKSMIPVIQEALEESDLKPDDLDAIAVTEGPGLIGSLLVGVETAKTLSRIWNKPLIPVNHLIGHFYANWIGDNKPSFPSIGLLVSGGHTDLVVFKDHANFEYIGGTRDDAAGECFDKCARLLNLPYPGGPQISKLAEGGQDTYKFPRPMMDSKDFDFSFSGLKTAVSNTVAQKKDSKSDLPNLCASIEAAIIDVLVTKVVAAAQKYQVGQIIVAGGVAANKKLSESIRKSFKGEVFIPQPSLCTDNGAMIAAAAFFNGKETEPAKVQANPNLSLAY